MNDRLQELAEAASGEKWWLWDDPPKPDGYGAVLAFAHEASPAAILAVLARVRELEAALRAVFQVAAVSWEGDPWYCEYEGIDAEAALALGRAALAASPEQRDEALKADIAQINKWAAGGAEGDTPA